MAAILEVEDLHVSYGETRVLHGIGFAVEARGITTILGANGAGKTTTLRAVSGIVPPRGRIALDGRRIDGKACEDIARLGIAHVPEGRGTFVGFTVEENLRLGAHVRRDRAAVTRTWSASTATSPCWGSAGARPRAPCRAASSRCSPSPAP